MSKVLNLSFFPYSACWKNISSGIAAGISWGHRGCWGMGQAPGKEEGEGMLPECSGLTQRGNWSLCSPWHQVYSSTCPLFSVLAQDALSSPTGAAQTLERTWTTLSSSSPAEPLHAPAVSPPAQNTFPTMPTCTKIHSKGPLSWVNHPCWHFLTTSVLQPEMAPA